MGEGGGRQVAGAVGFRLKSTWILDHWSNAVRTAPGFEPGEKARPEL